MRTENQPQWEFRDKYLEGLCQKAWNKLPEEVRSKAIQYVCKVSDDDSPPQRDQGTIASGNRLAIARFNDKNKDIILFRKDCNSLSDNAIVGAFVHEVAHAVKTAALTDQANPYRTDAIEHAGDALPSEWSFSNEISALIVERDHAQRAFLFGDATRNLLGQALISFAAGLLFLKSFSNSLQFLVAGLVMIALSLIFLAAPLGSIIKGLRGFRAFLVRYGTNLWFAFMVVSLARIVVAWGGAPNITVTPWLSTFLLWAAPLWIYVFSLVFAALAVDQVVRQVRYAGAKKSIPDLLVNLSWTLGAFAVFLLALTDVNIRWSMIMIGVAIVCLATNRLLTRGT
jgi:hypothetical protein